MLGVGAEPGLTVQAPWEQQHCPQGSWEGGQELAVFALKAGEGFAKKKKKRGPEVKVLRAGLLDGFKEEISSFTALFTGSWRMSLWFQVPAALVGDVLGQ